MEVKTDFQSWWAYCQTQTDKMFLSPISELNGNTKVWEKEREKQTRAWLIFSMYHLISSPDNVLTKLPQPGALGQKGFGKLDGLWNVFWPLLPALIYHSQVWSCRAQDELHGSVTNGSHGSWPLTWVSLFSS